MMDFGKINAVQAMQEYIVFHLDDEITMSEIASVSGYSKWYALRLFKELTDKTPFEYIRALRLTKAAQALRDSDHKVIEIALETNFESHDGFTRAFSRQFEITPQKYHKEKPPVSYFTYYPIRHAYLTMSKRNDSNMEKKTVSSTVTVTVKERPERKLVFLPSANASDYFSYCSEQGCDWEGLLNSVPEKMENAAVLTLPPHIAPKGMSTCAAGIEVPIDYAKSLPERYHIVELPPCKMLYFQGMPFENDDDFCEAIEYVMEAIQNYKPELYGFRFAYDIAPSFNMGASAQTGAKMIIPVIDMI